MFPVPVTTVKSQTDFLFTELPEISKPAFNPKLAKH